MSHRIKLAKPLEQGEFIVVFQNGVEKIYQIEGIVKVFPQLRELVHNEKLFQQIKIDAGGYGVSWNDELDLDAEEIWENGIETGIVYEMELEETVGEALICARLEAGMTQKQLAEMTGISQGDISKIERGLGNPSLNTLKRLAKGMGKRLKIEFIQK